MALEFSFNTPATSDSGTSLGVAHARLQVTLKANQTEATVRMRLFEDETAYLAGRKEIWLDEITSSLRIFTIPITVGQYANLNMTSIHNNFRDILLEGKDNGNYPAEADQEWLGLVNIDALNTVITNIPV